MTSAVIGVQPSKSLARTAMIDNVRANFGTCKIDKREIAVGKVKAAGKTRRADLWRSDVETKIIKLIPKHGLHQRRRGTEGRTDAGFPDGGVQASGGQHSERNMIGHSHLNPTPTISREPGIPLETDDLPVSYRVVESGVATAFDINVFVFYNNV
ncbi:hypothetical protein E1301_Tti012966 [Triplophysa tibetana]|uniref:Uncharacterized protein n=1 Tax=Triplophysa tibetana TaxID=1572043 RepID=A0A5A9NSJ0_9TELE|nr:hypothetical protein E1301_Tti012966 [Triplophysa tibetana]